VFAALQDGAIQDVLPVLLCAPPAPAAAPAPKLGV